MLRTSQVEEVRLPPTLRPKDGNENIHVDGAALPAAYQIFALVRLSLSWVVAMTGLANGVLFTESYPVFGKGSNDRGLPTGTCDWWPST